VPWFIPIDKELVLEKISEVSDIISELKALTIKKYEEMNTHERYSMRYLIIVLVESLASICVHLSLDQYGIRPKSYTECFREVGLRLGVQCYRELEALARLRNILVHRYWTVRDDLVYQSIKRDFNCVEVFMEKVKELAGLTS
jgi:uncharacterized protein YutE (UPF0331/DUF86 family)